MKNSRERRKLKPFAHDPPMRRARTEMHQVLLRAESYRISLLKKIATFCKLIISLFNTL